MTWALFQTPAECARQAIENDVRTLWASAHWRQATRRLAPAIIQSLKDQGGDIIVFCGWRDPAGLRLLCTRRQKGVRPRHPIPRRDDVLEQIQRRWLRDSAMR